MNDGVRVQVSHKIPDIKQQSPRAREQRSKTVEREEPIKRRWHFSQCSIHFMKRMLEINSEIALRTEIPRGWSVPTGLSLKSLLENILNAIMVRNSPKL